MSQANVSAFHATNRPVSRQPVLLTVTQPCRVCRAGGACRWLLSPNAQRPTDLSVDLSGLSPGDMLRLHLPNGMTVLLWPGLNSGGGGGGGGGGGDATVWSRTVGSGDILIELGRASPQGTSDPPPGARRMACMRPSSVWARSACSRR